MKDFIKEKYSKGHHYLPVFYLNGFSDDETLIHVYDKVKQYYLPKSSTKSKFKENNLYNFIHENQIRFTYEESFYTPLDTKSSILFNKIKNLTKERNEELSLEDQFDLLFFITHLYWRSPYSNYLIETIIKKEGFSNEYFQAIDKKTARVLTDDEIPGVINSILNSKENQKVFKTVYPLLDSNINEIIKLIDDWHLFYLDKSDTGLITGDMPIIVSNDNLSLSQVFQKLIFPISKHRLLIVNPVAPKFFESTLLHTINVCIFHQSRRFVCSDNRELLDRVIKDYSQIKKYGLAETIIEKLFQMIYFQSTFSTFEDYYDNIKKKGSLK